jgi:hypothetical protein
MAQVGLDPTVREDDPTAAREEYRAPYLEIQMSKAQQVFEALMRSKGHTDFDQSKSGKYITPAMQVRWTYFRMGWEMKGVTA